MKFTNNMMYGQSAKSAVSLPAWRRRLLLVFLLLGFVLLMLQSLYLQNTNKEFLQKKGDDRYSRTLKLQAYRGKISDRNGEILAVNSPVASVWADPSAVEMDAKQKNMLAKVLKVSTKDIDEKVANKKRSFVYVKRRISPDLAEKVKDLNISGIYLEREYRRFYPAGDVVAHVVGFTGVDGDGQEGVELKENEVLSGVAGKRRVIKDRKGHVVEELEVISEPRDGEALELSIDRRIQYLAFRELAKAVVRFKAKAASTVIL
ncbi:MAG TPA: penicillin-binding protein 2, partial [Methylophilaceae bacterium]|nr:penicillin-binding protein 2 [Methylophilaceae bacterium]